jgi:probable HAF family extracellular repeat protein
MKRQGIIQKVSSVTAQLSVMTATVGAIIAASAIMASAAGRYTLTAFDMTGNGINDSGQVVGSVMSWTGDPNFYLAGIFSNLNGSYKDRNLTRLDTLVPGNVGNASSTANGINNSSQVVGYSNIIDGGSIRHATVWSNGTVTDLGTIGNSYWSSSGANSINNSGQAVGWSETANGSRAALFSNGKVTDLGTLGNAPWSESVANSINNSGQIVGTSNYSAVFFSNGAVTALGTLGGSRSEANSINDSGQTVGFSSIAGDKANHAALYSNGKVTDLGTLGGTYSNAFDINNSGLAVGEATIAGDAATHAVLYSNGTATDLNSLVSITYGITLIGATGINNVGQIVGWGLANGSRTNFLLTPDSSTPTPTPTPIPAAAWLMGSGLMGLVGLRRKKALNTVG